MTQSRMVSPLVTCKSLNYGTNALSDRSKLESGAWSVAVACLIAAVGGCQPRADDGGARSTAGLDLSAYEIIDLTHSLNEHTIFWPTSPTKFQLDRLAYGPTPGGYFYSANAFSMPEHGGTHLDAPIHFGEGRNATDAIPLDRLVAQAIVIDIAERAVADPDYRLTAADVEAWEREHGRIPSGAIVLLRTGWSRRWPDRRSYLGDDTPGDASRLHFPSYGEDAARLLVEQRSVAALGADVASIDYGQSTDFLVHRVAAAANVPGLENLTDLERLPATGATVFALPVKIEGGSGGPVRAIALVPRGN
jgi:kynurenine formamidase